MPRSPFSARYWILREHGTGRVFAASVIDARGHIASATCERLEDTEQVRLRSLDNKESERSVRDAEIMLSRGFTLLP